jgi:hypothetical protein
MQKPGVSDLLKAFGQHMLQEAVQEGHRVQRHGRPGLLSRLVAEGHLAVFQAHETPVGQGDACDVRRQVFQGGFAVAHRLAVDDPIFRPGLRRNLREHRGIGGPQGISEFRSEDLTQGRGRHQEFRMRGPPRPGLRIDAARRHEIVDMDMVAHAPIPGVEGAEQTNPAPQPVRIARQGLEGLSGRLEQQVIDELLMRPRHRIQRMRQGEGDQEIGHREECLHLPVAPGIGAVAAALGTMTVSAGVVAVTILPAVSTPEQLPAHHGRAAVLDGPQRLRVARQHAVTILDPIGGAIVLDNLRQFQHRVSRQTRAGLTGTASAG